MTASLASIRIAAELDAAGYALGADEKAKAAKLADRAPVNWHSLVPGIEKALQTRRASGEISTEQYGRCCDVAVKFDDGLQKIVAAFDRGLISEERAAALCHLLWERITRPPGITNPHGRGGHSELGEVAP